MATYLQLILVAIGNELLQEWLYRKNHLWQEQRSLLYCALLSCNLGCLSGNYNESFLERRQAASATVQHD